MLLRSSDRGRYVSSFYLLQLFTEIDYKQLIKPLLWSDNHILTLKVSAHMRLQEFLPTTEKLRIKSC